MGFDFTVLHDARSEEPILHLRIPATSETEKSVQAIFKLLRSPDFYKVNSGTGDKKAFAHYELPEERAIRAELFYTAPNWKEDIVKFLTTAKSLAKFQPILIKFC